MIPTSCRVCNGTKVLVDEIPNKNTQTLNKVYGHIVPVEEFISSNSCIHCNAEGKICKICGTKFDCDCIQPSICEVCGKWPASCKCN